MQFWMKNNRWVEIAGNLGLSPVHAKTLLSLDALDPPPMGAIAEGLSCDASFVTNIVDKLEEKGLVERKPSKTDRRVKTVVITKAGLKLRERFEDAMFEPPKHLLDLSAADLKTLNRIVSQLPTD
jgi:DNA-binding MarR family transcriptional regulator